VFIIAKAEVAILAYDLLGIFLSCCGADPGSALGRDANKQLRQAALTPRTVVPRRTAHGWVLHWLKPWVLFQEPRKGF
jgi:hypothetical protein